MAIIRLVQYLSEDEAMRWGILFCIVLSALDLVSTMLGMRVSGLYETNPIMRDPVTLKFLLLNGVFLKFLGLVFLCSFPAWFLHKASDNSLIASLPFWYLGFHTLPVVLENFLLIWFNF